MAAVADFFETTPRNWRARLTIATDLMRELSRHTQPEQLYRAFTRRMQQLYPTARQLSVTRRGLEKPRVRVTRFNLWDDPVSPYEHPEALPVLNGGILADLLYSDDARIIDDLHVPQGDPAADFLEGQQSLLAIPLFEGGSALSMVVCTREEPHAFPREHVPELVWMCNLFGRALQSQVLSDRLQSTYDAADFELKAIGDMQHGLLPATVPRPAGYELAVHYQTAHRAGGDYYDFFPLSGGRVGVLIADASGHGTQAAVLLAITHTLVHAYPEPPTSPAKLLAYLNEHLGRRYTRTSGSFVTAFYAVFDPQSDAVTYANAGHLPPRVSRAGVPGWRPLTTQPHLPLGINPRGEHYPEQTAPFAEGYRFAAFTDGMLDSVNPAGDPFGYERLDAALTRTAPDANATVREAMSALDNFTGPVPLADDRTLLVVRRTAASA